MGGEGWWPVVVFFGRGHELERGRCAFCMASAAKGPSHRDVEWDVCRESLQWNWNIDRHRHRHLYCDGHWHWDWEWAIHWHWHLVWHGHGSVNHHYLSLEGWAWLVDFHFCLLGHCWKRLAIRQAVRGGPALMGRAIQGHVGTRTCSRGILETPHGVPSTTCCSHVMNGFMDE